MKKILMISVLFILQACVVPVTIGNKAYGVESEIKKRQINSPEVVSPEIYEVIGNYDDYVVMMVAFEPGESDRMHYLGNLLYYVIEGGMVQITLPDGTVNVAEIESDFFAKQDAGTEHMVKNIGSNTVRLLAIEEK